MITDDSHLDDLAEADASEVEYMFAQTAAGLAVDAGTMTLLGVSPSTLWFSDRPHRLTGHIATSDFVGSWGEGEDSFAVNPPNALLSIFAEDEVIDVVVVVGDPTMSNGDLSYTIEVLDGDPAVVDGVVVVGPQRAGEGLDERLHHPGRRRGGREITN